MRLPIFETTHSARAPDWRSDSGPRSIAAVRVLRISVTDRCNFRCVYCMPADGVPWLPKEIDPQLRGDPRRRPRRHRGARHSPIQAHRRRADRSARHRRSGADAPQDPWRRRPVADDQRHAAGAIWRGRCTKSGLDRVTVSIDSLRPRPLQPDHPHRRSADRSARAGPRRKTSASRSLKINCVTMRGDERR